MASLRFATIVALVAASIFQTVDAGCYFPLEFQGEFLTQSMATREIAYTSVSVLFDSIPSWGRCHRRLGKHVILASGDSEAADPCFKCVSIVSRSANVLQVHANEVGKCHSTEASAVASCPVERDIRERKATEMMLYKTKSFYGGSAITRTYCPLNGNYKFTYSVNDGTEDDLECREPVSHAGDCPSGYKFELHFRGCSFPNFDMSFQCLGSWAGDNGETYMSLLDTKLPQLGEDPRPRYRCALFKEDPDTGLTHMAFSSDSTCTRHLYSAQDGFETMHLEKLLAPAEPEDPALTCRFPDWLQGTWEGLTVDGARFSYRDENNFVTYSGTCMDAAGQDLVKDLSKGGADGKTDVKFLLKLRTECGAETYNCIQFQRRDSNVMEFQLGLSSTHDEGSIHHLSTKMCSDDNFAPNKWLTMGRLNPEEPPHCPLVGEYTGVIPDAESLCAKSYADCNNPEVMFYTVFNCNNASEVYEEREYRCFGQWTEPDTGLVYTYTERRDIQGHECFVGVDIDDDRSIVTEAGANCERGHQPRKYGMTLERQSKCPNPAWGERPVSPKLGNVHRTVKVQLESELSELEERYYEREMMADNDVITNEISDSYHRTNSAAAATSSVISVAAAAAVFILLACQ